MKPTLALAALLCGMSITSTGYAEAPATNLALHGTARSWHPNSVATVPPGLVNDGDPLTFWGSNEPTTDPPKDVGVQWDEPQRVGGVRIKFYSMGYVPAAQGWQLQRQVDGQWVEIPAVVENPDCEWWTFRFAPVETTAVRLLVTEYLSSRVAVSEFEVYAGPPPRPALRRAPLLDGAFWAFHYEGWAAHYPTDEALAAEVDHAHAAGLRIIILYNMTGRDGVFTTAVPDTVIPQSPWWQGRDPVGAILERADALGMRVYLTDASPNGFWAPVQEDRAAQVTATLDEFRRQMLGRYSRHPSLVGYYIDYELAPYRFDHRPDVPAALTQRLASFIKTEFPGLHVVMPVGLYSWRESPEAPWRTLDPDRLEGFWRPFIEQCPDVDAWMIIDGVGTNLSPLNFTDANQRRLREICDDLGTVMWTDVEVAVMGQRYETMPVGRVAQSLEVAARHADTVVGFCYINYMSPANGRELSRRLYDDYRTYRLGVLAAGGH